MHNMCEIITNILNSKLFWFGVMTGSLQAIIISFIIYQDCKRIIKNHFAELRAEMNIYK
jgi:hypothetical protein